MKIPHSIVMDSPEPDPDADLLVAFYDGDDQALDILYQRTHGKVYLVAKGFRLDEAETQDLVEEVFVKVFRTRLTTSARYERKKGRGLPWILRICTNVCRDHIR